MFKKYYDSMRPGPTPERVLAMCRLVNEEACTANELYKRTELDQTDKKERNEALSGSLAAAEELGLIEKRDNKYYYVGEKGALANYVSFRREVSKRAFSKSDTTFFKITEWFISQEENIFGLNRYEDYAAEVNKSGLDKVTENDILGWRFWMRFLGHAYIYNKTLIPNLCTRISDAMQVVECDKPMTGAEYILWLKTNIPEASSSIKQNAPLPLGISNGLRTLAEEGKIELISTKDALKVSLFELPGTEIRDFSSIIAKEGLYD